MDLPYKAEYSKSNRASCRGCKSQIAKDVLRIAAMVQSPMFDGKVPHWYHNMCFFTKQRPKTVDDIAHFESLRWEDQEAIKKKIENVGVVVPTKKGKKRDAAQASANKAALTSYVIEYAKSARAVCRGCQQKIMKDEIRVSKKDFETDVGKRYGGQDMWHHLTCFAKLRSELGYFDCGDNLPGFKALSKDDQKEVKKQIPAVKQEDVPVKKVKTEEANDKEDAALEKKMREQNKTMFSYRDKLKQLKKGDLQMLFEANSQDIPPGIDRMLDRLADIITFGALKRCPECKDGQLVFDKMGYACRGNLTEWSKCSYVTKEPKRTPFIVPTELAEEYSFLGKYKSKPLPKPRIVKEANPTVSNPLVKKEEPEEDDKPKVERQLPALYNMEFVIIGNVADKEALKKQIAINGGKVVTKIQSTVMAVISTAEDVDKKGARIAQAEAEDIQVVPVDFLDEIKEYSGRIPELVTEKSICDWGSDPHVRLPPEPTSSMSRSRRSMFDMRAKSTSSMVKLKLKGGGAVDPDSGLEDSAHVYLSVHGDKYTVVLGLTDIQKQKNSYYKLQLLEADNSVQYWLFRSWGRIGTTIGNTKLEAMPLYEATMEFERLYEEKTGNRWSERDCFVKVPNRMYPIDIDYGEDEVESKLNLEPSSESQLAKPIQQLISLIFDVNTMKKVMLEFELDTEKMPLGKLSKSQLQSAYKVLSELQELVESGATMARFIDASNRFYTFVPHSFGVDNPPVIDSLETIKKKIEMVENLMEMEIAYSLMKTTTSGSGKNSIDSHYEQLKTDINMLSHDSEEFQVIEEYVKNTHAATHSSYKLDIEEVFTVKRAGEEKRFKPFKKLHNRKLLWHGSRTTNYAGILSQGLRIAPPEAPVTGYMFGKGIYFADMVSKSANYCCTTPGSSTGLMLLCEVALGEMYELEQAKYVEKLPKGKHSVKGVGRTEPDPKTFKQIHNDVHVPTGKGVKNKSNKTGLLYNEYIVYDVAQVNIKYLLKMNFKYKY